MPTEVQHVRCTRTQVHQIDTDVHIVTPRLSGDALQKEANQCTIIIQPPPGS